jgi:hypothetical protein
MKTHVILSSLKIGIYFTCFVLLEFFGGSILGLKAPSPDRGREMRPAISGGPAGKRLKIHIII